MAKQYNESTRKIVENAKAFAADLKRRGWTRADSAKALGKMFEETPMHIADIPMKSEAYSIAARKLTAEELQAVAYSVLKEARIFFEDPRAWPSYEVFLGHQISKALLTYQIGVSDMTELDAFVKMVWEPE